MRLMRFAAIFLTGLVISVPAHAGNWGFGAEAGAITGAHDGTPFVFRLTPANRTSKEFGWGASFYISPAGEAKMYSGSLLVMFHVNAGKLLLTPFLGFGASHLQNERGDDTAIMFPVGGTLGFPVGESLYLAGTVSVNLHDIEIEGTKDATTVGLTAGIVYFPNPSTASSP